MLIERNWHAPLTGSDHKNRGIVRHAHLFNKPFGESVLSAAYKPNKRGQTK